MHTVNNSSPAASVKSDIGNTAAIRALSEAAMLDIAFHGTDSPGKGTLQSSSGRRKDTSLLPEDAPILSSGTCG